jgi:hypothetical protein
MSANVRCAGRGTVEAGGTRTSFSGVTCGWDGFRGTGKGQRAWLRGAEPRFKANPAWAVTAKPCPRCGGRVERLREVER